MMTRPSSAETPEFGDPATTIDPEEIEKFSKIAEEWWDPTGKFRPLHKFNPVRLGYIRDAVISHFDLEPDAPAPLSSLKLLDIGCGGGLVAEPMRRLGADVTAIDAAERNIKTATLHARQSGLNIDYRATTAEALAAERPASYDVVLNLEAVEHVADIDLFLKSSAALLKPGGVMIVATINRTLKAFALAKVGAEYVLGWLPRGTHDPRKFVKPIEIETALASNNVDVFDRVGVMFNPIADAWKITTDTSVNYMIAASKEAA